MGWKEPSLKRWFQVVRREIPQAYSPRGIFDTATDVRLFGQQESPKVHVELSHLFLNGVRFRMTMLGCPI